MNNLDFPVKKRSEVGITIKVGDFTWWIPFILVLYLYCYVKGYFGLVKNELFYVNTEISIKKEFILTRSRNFVEKIEIVY